MTPGEPVPPDNSGLQAPEGSGHDYGTDPSGGQLADVARQGAREWERDMAAWESDAEQLRRRARTLPEVLWEAMQRGDRVTTTVADQVFSGKLTAVRGDLAVLDGVDAVVAINLGAVGAVSLERGEDGVVGDRTHGSLRSYLGQLEVDGDTVRLIGDGFDVVGRVVAVAVDHVLVAGTPGNDWVIPLPVLGGVVVPTR